MNSFHPEICRWNGRVFVRWWRTLAADAMVRSLWIYLQIGLRVFPCYRVSLLVVHFAGKHRMRRREVTELEDRCGGMIQRGRVGGYI